MKSKSENYGEEIRKCFARWEDIKENGGSDPFWPDGTGLELTRGHIIWFKHRIEAELEPEDYPEEYFLELPPVMDKDYMAKKDEILKGAVKSLDVFKSDPDFLFIEKNKAKLSKEEKKRLCIENILNYAYGLEEAIGSKDYVSMRRKLNPEVYLESVRSCRKRMEEILGKEKVLPIGQLSLFDLFSMS